MVPGATATVAAARRVETFDTRVTSADAVSHEVAKAIVYNDAGGDMGRAKDVLSKYVSDHMYSMVGIPDAVIITHTETPRALRGRGIGSELVRGALELIRADGKKVIAGCGFVADYLDQHPENADLVA